MNKIWRKLKDILIFNFWREIKEKNTPRWVRRQAERFYDKCRIRPYNKIIFLKGKNHLYKVWYEMIGQGQIDWHYYKKLRTF